MLAVSTEPKITSHQLVSLLQKNNRVITYNSMTVTILQGNQSQTIAWCDIIKPITLKTSWFGGRLTLVTAAQTFSFKWLRYDSEQTHQQALLDCWINIHQIKLNTSLRDITQQLTKRYFKSSEKPSLEHKISQLASTWLGLADKMTLSQDIVASIKQLDTLYPLDEQKTRQFRAYFVQNELTRYKLFFDKQNSHPMTPKQRQACVINDDNNLVLAGAGSGKTSVMVGRVGYLLQSGLAKPSQILMLAYGKDAAQEMDLRLKNSLQRHDIKCATFHSLALSIINQVQGVMPNISVFATDAATRKSWLTEQFHYLINRQLSYKKQVIDLLNQVNMEAKKSFSHKTTIDQLLSHSDFVNLQTHVLGLFDLIRSAASALSGVPQYFDDKCTQATLEHYFMLVKPLIDAYQSKLHQQQAVDFDDMIFQAHNMIHTGKFKAPWLHILVDEFQDISEPRAQLLKALRDNTHGSVLFAVGDDWQSIYRFSGSNHHFITQFQRYFGASCTVNLDQTFRFNNKIAEVANRFVMQNPAQMKKELNSKVIQSHSAVTIITDFNTEKQNANVQAIIDALSFIDKTQKASVYILARFSFLLPNAAQMGLLTQRFKHLIIESYTVHSSKGKEADYVILVGMSEGKYGFPAKQNHNLIFDAFLPPQDDYLFAEERRLFYVALTRAKKHVYLIIPNSGISEFVLELINNQYDIALDKQAISLAHT
ncbi:UvrD-helicase domain-containing protein [Pseudoalteromonas tunicata]|uniref:UvrD-helicase domain-containing protein n=1 Tax=Pseudoalteromonas tunicata TaxID=314281 RepID=UPI00273DA5F2|nr:UvrD-helicase domain-containing protein [Pseudoalteromonas tunicata]MDP5214831.1 UvrD-helicase domain-containing protein [Pseudoalteromonas tunicata]